MRIPGFSDIRAARGRITPYLQAAPTWSYPVLNRVAGGTVYVKHEHVQPTGRG